ncbi:hypothetical protein XENORESO_017656 [Xenotaenia resolanae]|uniref:Transposase n=1 Tax=Xenotaenia resolanae TaxID=208358 RepID=A0ABV0WLG2_9TELE
MILILNNVQNHSFLRARPRFKNRDDVFKCPSFNRKTELWLDSLFNQNLDSDIRTQVLNGPRISCLHQGPADSSPSDRGPKANFLTIQAPVAALTSLNTSPDPMTVRLIV